MTTSSSAKTQPQPNTPGSKYHPLEIFVGTWTTDGQQYAGPIGPAARISAVQTFEWLTGGLFLVHRFEGQVDQSPAACIEVIGYDPVTRSYPTHTYYNNGVVNKWQQREQDGDWILTGDWQMEDKSIKVRCTTVFSDNGTTMTAKWEYLDDDSKWQTFWDVRSTKAANV